MPGICLVLNGPTLDDCHRQLEESRPWIDLAELRADKISSKQWPELNRFSRDAGIPLILTLRQRSDGGDWDGPPAERVEFFENALTGAWRWADIEDKQRIPRWEQRWISSGRELIVSFHEFEGLGEHWLERILAAEGPGVVVKAALMPRSSAEYDDFLEGVLGLPSGRRVLLAMGGFGFSSRILAARLGSLWTYASPPGQVVAPGQTDPKTLVELYRFRKQTTTTPVYGVMGNPVFHSQSPHIHNPALEALDLAGTYLPFLADDPRFLLKSAGRLGVKGLSCTIPHKQAVVPLVESLSDAARQIGAVNTLVRTTTGWHGDNTDGAGFLEPLTQVQPELKSATVIGTGGSARAVAWALVQAGVQVLVLGRDLSKARRLAQNLGAQAALLDKESLPLLRKFREVIVQTTNVGMGSMEGQDPLEWYTFDGSEIAYDIIYSPERTVFLSRAEQAGCRLLFGRQMLEHQAWRQFRLFTGRAHPGIT